MGKKPANQKKGHQGPAPEAVANPAPMKKEAMDLDVCICVTLLNNLLYRLARHYSLMYILLLYS